MALLLANCRHLTEVTAILVKGAFDYRAGSHKTEALDDVDLVDSS